MIKTKADLKFYIEEDKKRNLWQPNRSYLYYLAKLLYGSADAKAFHYMKALRKYEYTIQCKKNINKCITAFVEAMASEFFIRKIQYLYRG